MASELNASCREKVNAEADRMFNRTLAASLNDFGERGWTELKKTRQIDALWLAKRFQPYDVRPRTIWIGDEHAKGYLKTDFQVLFNRYIPNRSLTHSWRSQDRRRRGSRTQGQRIEDRRLRAEGRERRTVVGCGHDITDITELS